MARRKPTRPASAEKSKVAKALRDAIRIADAAIDKLEKRGAAPKRPKRKN
jgi:hypothetical protein